MFENPSPRLGLQAKAGGGGGGREGRQRLLGQACKFRRLESQTAGQASTRPWHMHVQAPSSQRGALTLVFSLLQALCSRVLRMSSSLPSTLHGSRSLALSKGGPASAQSRDFFWLLTLYFPISLCLCVSLRASFLPIFLVLMLSCSLSPCLPLFPPLPLSGFPVQPSPAPRSRVVPWITQGAPEP